MRDAIGDLPSLDPFISDVSKDEMSNIFPQYFVKAEAGKRVSVWHKPPKHIYRQVITMMHTPTGKTAFDNEYLFQNSIVQTDLQQSYLESMSDRIQKMTKGLMIGSLAPVCFSNAINPIVRYADSCRFRKKPTKRN